MQLPRYLLTTVILALPASAQWAWRDARVLPGRAGASVAFDTVRERLVAFGGGAFEPAQLADTWAWDGSKWLAYDAVTRPPARAGAPMVCDIARQRLVLFGGGSEAPLADTWEWDGSTWRQGPGGPSSRFGHAMAYDGVRRRVVLYGGTAGTTGLRDTWEYDGVAWSRLAAIPTTPPGLIGHAMTYDSGRQRVVMFGDATGSTVWEYDGSDWRAVTAPGGPPAGRRQAMAYDPVRRRVVLYGPGSTSTWEWDGSAWTQRAVAGPGAVNSVGIGYGRGRILLVRDLELDVWAWDGSAWTVSSPEPVVSPSFPLVGRTMAFDSTRGTCVMFGGGNTDATPIGETWEFDDTWHRRAPTTRPPARRGCAMADDPARRQVVLFGGGAGSLGFTPLGDTWTWDGTTWLRQTPSSSPSARLATRMTFDSVRQRVLLFGGQAAGGALRDDTWEWDGATWTQRAPTRVPPARAGLGLAFDARRGRAVLFGGVNQQSLDDTWEWDGSDWTLLTPARRPPAGFVDGLFFDAAQGVTILIARTQVWQWDGTDWTQLAPTGSPAQQGGYAITYDSWRGRAVAWGGFLEANFTTRTRYFGALRDGARATLGTGCNGNAPPPVLISSAPFFANPGLAFGIEAAQSNSVAALGLAAAQQPRALGPCTWFLQDPVVALPTSSNGFGFASVTFAVPASSWLRGVDLYAQAVVLDARSPIGLALTPLHRVTFGD